MAKYKKKIKGKALAFFVSFTPNHNRKGHTE